MGNPNNLDTQNNNRKLIRIDNCALRDQLQATRDLMYSCVQSNPYCRPDTILKRFRISLEGVRWRTISTRPMSKIGKISFANFAKSKGIVWDLRFPHNKLGAEYRASLPMVCSGMQRYIDPIVCFSPTVWRSKKLEDVVSAAGQLQIQIQIVLCSFYFDFCPRCPRDKVRKPDWSARGVNDGECSQSGSRSMCCRFAWNS